MGKNDLALKEFLQWLRQRHSLIMQTEARALACLEKDDIPNYSAGMHSKAKLLADMADEAAPLMENLPARWRLECSMNLGNFSASAKNALQLDSLFYMSALLYPDTHQKGEPDNLLLYIESLEKKTDA